MLVGPDRGHSGINRDRMMESFIEKMVMYPAAMEIPAKATR